MPGFDGTGPCGMGPKSGRGRGRCSKKKDVNSLEKRIQELEDELASLKKKLIENK